MTRLLTYGCLALLLACTPKATPEITTTETASTPPVPRVEAPAESLSPCTKFTDVPGGDAAETNYVLYRDALKRDEWDNAFEKWQQVYEVAPAADGRRNTVYADGIRFYEYFISRTDDEKKKMDYRDAIFALYDEIDKCYPEGGYVMGRKAFDMYYKYPDMATPKEQFDMFSHSMDMDGDNLQDFVVNPMADLLVRLYADDQVDLATAKKYERQIQGAVERGLADCEGTGCERWKIIANYAPQRLEYFESVKGFYDCDYYVTKYYPEFRENPGDCDVISTLGSRLAFAGCDRNRAEFQAISAAYSANQCGGPATVSSGAGRCYTLLRDADYREAIGCFEQSSTEATDPERRAKYNLTIAKIYYAHLKNFSQARKYARLASEARPNWGEPYLLIGRLYASSGPLCGPGTGFESQKVVWPAIDMWQKAKSVDPEAAAEANKWIGKYAQYMPSNEDIFQRGLKEGASFNVGCWIGESTRVRAAQ